MAGTIIADKIQTENSFLTLNVGQTQVASLNAGGIYSATGTKIIGTDGSIAQANTLYVGANASSTVGGATNPIIGAILSANNYVQNYIYNPSNTALASADIACYPNNGTDANGWIDMGITSNTYSYSGYPITGRNEGYILMSAPGGSGTSGNLVFATDSTGAYNSHQWYVGGFSQAKTNAKMTLTGTGLGIGVAVPTRNFQLTQNTSTAYADDFDSTVNQLYLTNPNTTTNTFTGIQMDVGGNSQAAIQTVRTSDGAAAMIFSTRVSGSRAERMRIDSSGNLLVGCTAAPSASVKGTSISADLVNIAANKVSAGSGTGTTYLFAFLNGNGQVGSISVSGSATAYTTSSDYRLKENIAPMTGALNKISQLKPVTYKWKADGSDGEGFIAHELQEVVAGCVTGEKDAVDANGKPEYQGVDTSFLVATLTAAIQELKAIVDAQAVEIAALKAK